MRTPERMLQRQVLQLARLRGWRTTHFRPALTERGWRTPLQGDAGFPDLVLARAGVVLIVELKRDGARPTPEQRAWLEALGHVGRLWTPSDWDEIQEALT